MKVSRLVTSCSAFALLALSVPLLANNFGGRVSVSTQVSNNAEKTEIDELQERQDKASLGLFGDYENSLVTFNANYSASTHRYEKDTQPSRDQLEGESTLRFGKDRDFVDLLLTHTRRSLLSEPDALDLLSNRDERQIFSVVPTLRANITAVDSVMVSGIYSETDYRYDDFRNSKSEGASLALMHKFSAVDVLTLTGLANKITFDEFPDSDYQYESVTLGYSALLRQMHYNISVGYNRSGPEVGEDYSSPTYAVELGYDSGINSLTFYASQIITDTSTGDGNRSVLDRDINFGSNDVSGTGIDQIERRSLELRWDNKALCDRCDIYVSIYARDDDYLNLDEDNNERGGRVGMAYRLSNAASISLSFNRSEQRFDDDMVRDEFTLDQLRGSYTYNFINDLSVSFFAEQRERKSQTDTTNYEEGIIGVSLAYGF
jgi:hypothetical protein